MLKSLACNFRRIKNRETLCTELMQVGLHAQLTYAIFSMIMESYCVAVTVACHTTYSKLTRAIFRWHCFEQCKHAIVVYLVYPLGDLCVPGTGPIGSVQGLVSVP